MLIKETFFDIQTSANGKESTMRIFLFHPTIPGYPNARFPGVVLFSEIYQVTGPVARFARQIAGQGYLVAAPSSFHDFTGPEPLAYDVPGTDQGNEWKVAKTLESYDEDSVRTVDHLLTLPNCTGRIGATGMCLGGHLALRASLDPRISACVTYFATDVHSRTLGPHGGANASPAPPTLHSPHTLDQLSLLTAPPPTGPGSVAAVSTDDDSDPFSPPTLARFAAVAESRPRTADCECALLFGIRDTHVPDGGRDLIRTKLREAGAVFSWHEFAWAQHAFIRDELSKGRYDPAVTKACFEVLLEVFGRVLKTDLGAGGEVGEVEHVC